MDEGRDGSVSEILSHDPQRPHAVAQGAGFDLKNVCGAVPALYASAGMGEYTEDVLALDGIEAFQPDAA